MMLYTLIFGMFRHLIPICTPACVFVIT